MNSIIPAVPTTMSSRDISELTGKRHSDVLRDIDNLLEALSAELRLGFKSDTYKDSTGKENRMFVMDRDSTYCLVAGYDANARMRIIKRWQELESKSSVIVDYEDRPAIIDPHYLESAFSACYNIAVICGIKDNMAILSADQGTRKLTGVSALALIGATHLIADQRGMTYNPTELGLLMNPERSARWVNLSIQEIEFQYKDATSKWVPTKKAEGYYEWADTGKRKGDGTPVKQLKWFRSILERIDPQMREAA